MAHPMLHARGALAQAHGNDEEAWRFATQLNSPGKPTHVSTRRGLNSLRGKILAASGRLSGALPLIQASVALAKQLQTRRDISLGNLALAKTFLRLGKDR